VEDTHVTNDIVTEVFGDVVGEYVGWLTDISRPEYGNRAVRKQMDRDYIAGAPAAAQTIKLCDLISNCSSIREHDENFAKTYFEEKRLLLEVLTKGNPVLLERARALVV
jgi:(p)ppGpp synthase/HD superfamily hydrolase